MPPVFKNRPIPMILVSLGIIGLLAWFLPASEPPALPKQVYRYMWEHFGLPEALVNQTWNQFWLSNPDPLSALQKNTLQLARESINHTRSSESAASFSLPAGYQAKNDLSPMIFAHVVDGPIGGSSKTYRTVFFLTNLTTFPSQGYIEFFDDQGKPMTLTMQGETNSRFPISLAAGALVRLTTSGLGSLKAGWARVMSDQLLSGSGSFNVSDPSGTVYSDVGIGVSFPGTRYSLFVDSKGIADTGIAMVNPDESQSLVLQLELRNAQGVLQDTQKLTLSPRGHQASFFTEIFSKVAGIQEFEGSLTISGERPFEGITLRILGDQLTSLPLIPPPFAGTSVTLRGFAQVADGLTGPGGLRYATSIILLNPTEKAQQGTLEFFQSNGSPLDLTLNGQLGNNFPYQLQPYGVLRWTSTGSGAVKVGWARVTGENIRGSLIFQVQDAAGRLLTEAGVPDNEPTSNLQWIADSLGRYDTGLALANTDSYDTAKITLSLINNQGQQVTSSCLFLGPMQQKAIYLTEVFKGVPSIGEFEGRLIISSSENLIPLSLRSLDEKLTSTATLIPWLAYAPDLVFEPAQNLAGTSPPILIRRHQSGMEWASQSVKVTAPGLLAKSDSVKAGDVLGYGYYLADASLLARGMIYSGIVVLRAVKDGSLDFEAVDTKEKKLVDGSISNQTDGVVLQISFANAKAGQTMMGLEFDLVFHLFANFIQLPDTAKTITLQTENQSVVIMQSDQRRLTRKITQPLSIVAADRNTAEIDKVSALLVSGGEVLRLDGSRFGQNPQVAFIGPNNDTLRATAKTVGTNSLEVVVPKTAQTGPIQVEDSNGKSNPFWIRNIFSPRISGWYLNPNAGATSGFSMVIEQSELQFPMGRLQFQMTGVASTLPSVAVGTKVGVLRLYGGAYANLSIAVEREIRGGTSTADETVLDIVDTSSNKVESRLRISKITTAPQGLQFNFDYRAVPALPALYKYASRWELYLTDIPLVLPAAPDSPMQIQVTVYSYPTGPGKMLSALKNDISLARFTLTGATPQTIATLPTTTTTTIFRCDLPSSTTTLSPPTSSTSSSSTLRVTTSSSTLRPTTTLLSTSTSSTIRLSTTTTTVVNPTTTSSTSSSTLRPTTTITTTSSSSSLRATTSSTTSTSSSIRPTTSTSSSSTIRPTTTTLIGVICNLFSADFNSGSLTGWSAGLNARWRIVNGRLQVDTITDSQAAVAETDLPYPNIFGTLSMDVQALNFNNADSWIGFEIFDYFAQNGQYVFNGASVDGFGAAITGNPGNVALIYYDINSGYILPYDQHNYGNVTSIGVELAPNQVKLLVNGVIQKTYSVIMPSISMDTLDLFAAGMTTVATFDNICQSSPPILVQKTLSRDRSNAYRRTTKGIAKAKKLLKP